MTYHCPWHVDCTPLDCDKFVVRPKVLHRHVLEPTPASRVVDAIATLLAPPTKGQQ